MGIEETASDIRKAIQERTEAQVKVNERISNQIERQGGTVHPYVLNMEPDSRQIVVPGMTILDYFAGQALAGLLSNRPEIYRIGSDDAANLAYNYAGAMVAEKIRREKQED